MRKFVPVLVCYMAVGLDSKVAIASTRASKSAALGKKIASGRHAASFVRSRPRWRAKHFRFVQQVDPDEEEGTDTSAVKDKGAPVKEGDTEEEAYARERDMEDDEIAAELGSTVQHNRHETSTSETEGEFSSDTSESSQREREAEHKSKKQTVINNVVNVVNPIPPSPYEREDYNSPPMVKIERHAQMHPPHFQGLDVTRRKVPSHVKRRWTADDEQLYSKLADYWDRVKRVSDAINAL